MRRLCRTRSVSVRTTIPSSTLRAHDGTSAREPSTSTTHTRQALIGVRFGAQHSVGVSTARAVAARRGSWRPPGRGPRSPSTVSVTSSRADRAPPVTVRHGASRRDRPSGAQAARARAPTDGRGRGLPEPADRRVLHDPGEVVEQAQLGVPGRRRAAGQPGQRLLLAHGADPARHALPARLVAEERGDPAQRRGEVGDGVEGEHDARPERGPDLAGALQGERDVELVGQHEPARRAAEQHRPQLAAHPAGQREQLAQGGAERHLVDAGDVHRARDAEQLRAGRAPAADRRERGAADARTSSTL